MGEPVRAMSGGVEVTVWVVPGATRPGIVGLHDGAVRVRVSVPAEGGKANRAVEALLAETVGGRVRLMAGGRSRRKRFLVEGAGVAAVRRGLGLAGSG